MNDNLNNKQMWFLKCQRKKINCDFFALPLIDFNLLRMFTLFAYLIED